jgi:membrane-associated protease RseP (regulator of RpoE activity)
VSDFPFYLAAFLVVLGVLVVIHELGHYLAARYCGVKVLRFSVGFGPVIFQRKCGVDRTEWAIAAIPLGGFVKMLDEREGEVASDELCRAFNQQTVGKRSLIVAAGAIGKFCFGYSALLSISLCVLNLLPIPMLDGGHLMYYTIELIRGGPVSERIMEIGQQIGLAFLLMLMAFAFYNDINRLFG